MLSSPESEGGTPIYRFEGYSLSWMLGLGSYLSNYSLNFKREIITIFYIINDTWQLLTCLILAAFDFDQVGPPKSTWHLSLIHI